MMGKNMATKLKLVLARVLVLLPINNQIFSPNDLIEGEESVIDAYEKNGQVDTNAGAIAYCKNKLKQKTIKISSKAEDDNAAAIAAAEGSLKNAQEALAAADDTGKEAAQKAVDEAQAALDALK